MAKKNWKQPITIIKRTIHNSFASGMSRCKLLYIDWINSKVLVFCTGSYVQCPEKNMKKTVCIYKSLVVVEVNF